MYVGRRWIYCYTFHSTYSTEVDYSFLISEKYLQNLRKSFHNLQGNKCGMKSTLPNITHAICVCVCHCVQCPLALSLDQSIIIFSSSAKRSVDWSNCSKDWKTIKIWFLFAGGFILVLVLATRYVYTKSMIRQNGMLYMCMSGQAKLDYVFNEIKIYSINILLLCVSP